MSEPVSHQFKNWFSHQLPKVTPLQAAAACIAEQKNIEDQNWQGSEANKQQALNDLGAIITSLYMVENMRLTKQKDKLHDGKFGSKFYNLLKLFDEANNDPDRASRFNKIASPKKTDFLKRAQRLSTNYSGLDHSTILTMALQVTSRQHESWGDKIQKPVINYYTDFLEIMKKEDRLKYLDESRVPDGPKNIRGMLACLYAYKEHHKLDERNQNAASNIEKFEYDALNDFIECLEKEQSDLPEAMRQVAKQDDLKAAQSVLQTQNLNNGQLFKLIDFFGVNMTHKLKPDTFDAMKKSLLTLGLSNLADAVQMPGHPLAEQKMTEDKFFDKVFDYCERLATDYFKPDTKDVIEQLTENARQKFKNKPQKINKILDDIENARQEKPDGMEEVVIAHYPEDQQTRKLRSSIFRSKYTLDGEEGIRMQFIKDLALNEQEDLKAVGFSDEDIGFMRDNGILPEGSDWTVEHIIDRESGGTNHPHNFILMPEEINNAKDKLKKAQLKLNPDADQGCWIISWLPKKQPDGTYPKIFKPETPSQNNHEPVAEQEIPEITLH